MHAPLGGSYNAPHHSKRLKAQAADPNGSARLPSKSPLSQSVLLQWSRGHPNALELIKTFFPDRAPAEEREIRSALVRTIIEHKDEANCLLAVRMLAWRRDTAPQSLAALAHGTLHPKASLTYAMSTLATLNSLAPHHGALLSYACTFLPRLKDKGAGLNALEIMSTDLFFRRTYELLLEGELELNTYRAYAMVVNTMIRDVVRYRDIPLMSCFPSSKVTKQGSALVADLSGTDWLIDPAFRDDAATIARIIAAPNNASVGKEIQCITDRDRVLGAIVCAARRAWWR